MATQLFTPFRYPTQSLADLELVEDVPIRSTGMTAAVVEAAFGSPHPKSAEHLLVWQEPVVARDGTLSMRRVYRKLPGAALSGELVRESTWGAPAQVVSQDVAAGTHADTGLNVVESAVEPKDAQLARKRTTTVQWPALTSQRLNARGDVETLTEGKVAPSTPLPAACVTTTELRLQAETVDRSRLVSAAVTAHAELIDKARGDSALIPGRLRAAELYQIDDVIVPPETEPDALSASVVESRVVAKTRAQSVKRTTSRTGANLPSVTDRKLGPHGELLESTEALVDVQTTPAGAFDIATDSVHDTGTGVAVRSTTRLAAGQSYPVLSGYSIEPETRTPVTIVRDIVPADTVLDTPAQLVIDRKLRAVDKWRSIRIVTSLDALPAAFSEQKHIRFRFPGLFYSYDPVTGIASYRHAVSCMIPALVQVSFGYELVNIDFLVIRPVSWHYPSGFTVSSVLTNGEQIDYTTTADAASDSSGATAAATHPLPTAVTVPLSNPTRAQYEALIGTYATVTGASERWKGGVWRTETWQVKLE